jgi:putative ABC transport system permease protein
MQSVFGLPADQLAVVLMGLVAVVAGVVTVLALRNVVLLKMGLRNIVRRRARSALIIVGLMLGTAIIASSLLTGDTMGRTVRASVLDSLGYTDEYVTATGPSSGLDSDLAVSAAKPYFDADSAMIAVDRAVAGSDLVDGTAPAIIELTAAQNLASRRTEPRLTLFASEPNRLEPFRLNEVAGVGLGDALLNEDAADELDGEVGDTITVFTGADPFEVRIAGIGRYPGAGADGPTMLMTLETAQRLLGREGEINHVMVSNAGGEVSGATHSDEVVALLEGELAPLGLTVASVKADGLEAADALGNAFMTLFTTFGTFSMAAGILLIFLIFVMLAAERRSEMGMARAIGTRRGHLVETFVFEGAAYDLAAAAIGAALGIAISWVMVQATASAFSTADDTIDLRFAVQPRSLLIAYGFGVLLTFLVVSLSAWRVSRLNIVSAIRSTAEPVTHRSRWIRWGLPIVGIAIGLLLVVSGIDANQYLPWMLGVSLLIISIVPMLRVIGLPDRIAFTTAGLALVVWWLLPFDTFESVLGEMEMDFSVWVAGGLLQVVGATWLVTYNADVLLGAVQAASSRLASLAPVMKLAITYPLRDRFRTGVTLAMFTLVVFTLVTGTTISNAFINAFNDPERFGGGYDVRASTAPALAIDDLRAALPDEVGSQIEAVGSQSFLPLEAAQDGAATQPAIHPVRGLDDEFLDTNGFEMATMASGYGSSEEVWQAMRADPTLAVVDPYVVPRRENWGAGVLPDFQLSGFFFEDPSFQPVPVTLRDTQSGDELHVTIIGVLRDDIPFEMAGVSVSQEMLAPFGERAAPTMHHVALAPGADATQVADQLESLFLANGLEAESYRAVLDDAVGGSLTFNRLVQGFMGLGLLVGVAALGVISARAVVERRQQIGVLRAIGFQPAMVRRTLLLESSFISGTAIIVGSVLGLFTSYNVIANASQQANYTSVSLDVPWLNLAIVFGIVYLAALGATLAPAIRASRVYPAEALRYQ